MTSHRNQLNEYFKSAHIRKIQFKDYTVDSVGVETFEAGLPSVGHEQEILRYKTVSIVLSIIESAVNDQY
ncbi:hypothetical protein [Nitrospira sp. KM1]|uniref:hypothetical protein n=1 Tax=Nitrospira sp. KM1 TaxID=1936990 RepID=UPI001E30566F|nr:hypothetical protein [Nitrospira sp. KM1]